MHFSAGLRCVCEKKKDGGETEEDSTQEGVILNPPSDLVAALKPSIVNDCQMSVIMMEGSLHPLI